MFWFCVGPAFRSSWLLWLPVITGIVTSPVQAMVELNHKVKMSKDDEVRGASICMLAVSAGTNTEEKLLSDTSEWILTLTVQHSALTLHRLILMILWCVGSWVLSPLVNVLDLSFLPLVLSTERFSSLATECRTVSHQAGGDADGKGAKGNTEKTGKKATKARRDTFLFSAVSVDFQQLFKWS